MDWMWATLLVLLNLVWLASIAFGLPGIWLMIGGAIGLELWRGNMFSVWTLLAVVVIGIIAELLEFLAGVVGARKAGSSKLGAVGALVGSLAGALIGTFLIPIPLIGTLIGACGGAFLGTFALERMIGRPSPASIKSATGAGIGRLAGTVIKLAAGVVIGVIIAVAAFWP